MITELKYKEIIIIFVKPGGRVAPIETINRENKRNVESKKFFLDSFRNFDHISHFRPGQIVGLFHFSSLQFTWNFKQAKS